VFLEALEVEGDGFSDVTRCLGAGRALRQAARKGRDFRHEDSILVLFNENPVLHVLLQAVSVLPTSNLLLSPDRVMSDDVRSVTDVREFQRAGVPKGRDGHQPARRETSC